MKDSSLIIRIPEPCHEDWNKMQPDDKGKFCNSCNKSVFDFTNKTDTEIRDILMEHKDQKVCGHFKKSQVNRPLNIRINLNDIPKNMSMTKVFAVALFLVFGTLLFSCTNQKDEKVGQIEIENKIPEQYTIGSMIMPLTDSLRSDSISEVIWPEETVTGREEMVDGGISYEVVTVPRPENIPEVVEPYIIDSTKKEPFVLTGNSQNYKDSLLKDKLSDQAVKTNLSDFIIYPNPSNGEFAIKYEVLKRSDVIINLFDINGAFLRSIVNVNGQYEGKYQIPVNVSELPNGIYVITLINNGTKTTGKVIIEK